VLKRFGSGQLAENPESRIKRTHYLKNIAI